MIPYGRQDISDDDIDAVLETLKSDYLTQGPKVPEFEKIICSKVGASYAVAVNSATSALHIALLSLEVTKGDIVWTTPNTFVATANVALYCGASIDFVDIDPNDLNLSVEKLEKKLEIAKIEQSLPKVVIPVHFSGRPCDMVKIKELSKIYNFKIIEDASHAIGGTYEDNYIGACKYSDITVFSFHPVKIITTAEGGLAVTNDPDLKTKMDLYRSHGITRDKNKLSTNNAKPWFYEQQVLGFNYRMTELQAALGISQSKRLDEYINKRRLIVERYNKILSGLPLLLPKESNNSSWHLYVIQCSDNQVKQNLFNFLRDNDILVNVHYIPVHTQPYYKSIGFRKGDYICSEEYYDKAISLPLYPTLKIEEQDYIVNKIREFFE